MVDDGPTCGKLHAGHGGHGPSKHRICITEKMRVIHCCSGSHLVGLSQLSFTLLPWKQLTSLTGASIVLDPVEQLFLRQVAELANDRPLGLQVGHSIYGHGGHHCKHHNLVLKLLPDPAEQLPEQSERAVGKDRISAQRTSYKTDGVLPQRAKCPQHNLGKTH